MNTLGIGCGLLIDIYIMHSAQRYVVPAWVETRRKHREVFPSGFARLVFIVGRLGPLVEEIFFRGFSLRGAARIRWVPAMLTAPRSLLRRTWTWSCYPTSSGCLMAYWSPLEFHMARVSAFLVHSLACSARIASNIQTDSHYR